MKPEAPPSRWRRLAGDPVVRFLVLGAAIFGVHRALAPGDDAPIVVSSRFVEGLRAEHRERFGRQASPAETTRLIDDYVRQEALVREAMRLGLDRGDPIVRRRLTQKMELLLRGQLTIERPDEAAIRRWIAAHPDEVARGSRYDLRHAFASRDRRATPRADAEAWIASANASDDPEAALRPLGDAFALGPTLQHVDDDAIARQLGEAFRQGLAECALGRACGPLESPYGFHAVVVTALEPAGTLPYASARPIAERALLRDREEAALARAIEALVARVGVRRVDDRSPR